MKVGDRVELTEQMEDLIPGLQGVIVKETAQIPISEYPYSTKPQTVLAVQFDTLKYPAVGRRLFIDGKEKYIFCKDKCRVI